MYHIVFFSSGKASYAAGKLVAEKYGTENLFLVFGDTSIEDEDNYRFLVEAAENIGGKLIWLKDGRTPWDIFFETKFINHRQSACSISLKINPCERWIRDCEFNPSETLLYYGVGFEELERMEAIREHWSPFQCLTPLTWGDGLSPAEVNELLKREGLRQPRLYDMGFAHANCGGFCIKAGQKHYRNLLNHLPEVYARHEEMEQRFRLIPGRENVAILRKMANGKKGTMSLKEFRESLASEEFSVSVDQEALGGCGCFLDVGVSS